MNTTIFVTGLPKYLDKELLSSYFRSFGEIHFIRIFTKENNQGKTEGFAKIKFKDREALIKSTRFLTHNIGELVVKVRELKTQAELESQISKKSRLLYVTNVHYGTKKAEFKKFIIPKVGARRVVRMIKNKKGKKQKEKEMEMFGKVEKIKSAVLELNSRDKRPVSFFTDLEIDYRGKRLCFKCYEEKDPDEEREGGSQTGRSNEQGVNGQEMKENSGGERITDGEQAAQDSVEMGEEEGVKAGTAKEVPQVGNKIGSKEEKIEENDNDNTNNIGKNLNTSGRQFHPCFIIPHLQKKPTKAGIIPVNQPVQLKRANESKEEEKKPPQKNLQEEEEKPSIAQDDHPIANPEIEESFASKFQKRKSANVVSTRKEFPRLPTEGVLRYQEEDKNLMFNFPVQKAKTYKQALFIHKQLQKAREYESNEVFLKDIKIEISYLEFIKFIQKNTNEKLFDETEHFIEETERKEVKSKVEELGPHGFKPTTKAYFSNKANQKSKKEEKNSSEE